VSEIGAAQVKELRERTGAGMMDCKTALQESGGDMAAAIQWLRSKGLAAAAKKAGRIAAEGLVAVAVDGAWGVIVEVNSETDFVARNDSFQELAANVAKIALEHSGDYAATSSAPYPEGTGTIADKVGEMVGKIGENLQFRRSAGLQVGSGIVASYVHNAVVPGMGKIGVLVALESTADVEALAGLGKQLAMHVAAANPQSVSVADLDPAVVAQEREVYSEQARESGKPDDIIEKIVEGRLRKFYGEAVLQEQVFVIDNERKIAKVIEDAAQDAGAPVAIVGFLRFALGEGIEKREEDFAGEVAAAQSGE
jgi:elongation factor Ts